MKVTTRLTEALVSAWLLTGCAHQAHGTRVDVSSGINTQELVSRFGYAKCTVSLPLSQDEAVKSAKLVGAAQIDQRTDWAEMISVMTPGDELRHVWCNPHRGPGGVDLIGVFRDKKLIAEMHTVFVD